jgi:hypothetical protein
VVIVLAAGPKIRVFRTQLRTMNSLGRQKSAARVPSEGKSSRRPHVVIFYDMLSILGSMGEIFRRQN